MGPPGRRTPRAEGPAKVVEELYAVPLSAFTRERDARAAALKRAGDADAARAVQALRKPTATLWATNQLAHAEPERLERFVASVERLRRSQLRDARAAAEAMGAQRAELDALVERAEELLKGAGFRASPGARDGGREASAGGRAPSRRGRGPPAGDGGPASRGRSRTTAASARGRGAHPARGRAARGGRAPRSRDPPPHVRARRHPPSASR